MNAMPANKREHLIYTFLMVFFMAIVMTTYNVMLHNGFSIESLKKSWLMFPLTFVIAFICEWFIVGRIALKLTSKFLKKNDPVIMKILVTALFFVTGMATLMSFFGTLISNGFTSDILSIWLKNISMNFPVAYTLQVVIAGPFIGFIFRKLFPIGTVIG